MPTNNYLREAVGKRLELIGTQGQKSSNNCLREALRERLELIAIQKQRPTADQRPERRRQLADLAATKVPFPQFATLIKLADSEHLLATCTRSDEHDVIHQDLGCLAVLASAEHLPYPLLHKTFSHARASTGAWQHTCRMQAHSSSLFCSAISPIVVLHASIIKTLWDRCSPVEAAMIRIIVRRFASFSTCTAHWAQMIDLLRVQMAAPRSDSRGGSFHLLPLLPIAA